MEDKIKMSLFFIQITIGITLFMIGVSLMLSNTGKENITKVKCYDKNNNEIIGVECKQIKYIPSPGEGNGMVFLVAGMFLSISSFLWLEVLSGGGY